MAAASLDLLLPDSGDRAAALALLRERLELEEGRERLADRVLLDSFDRRLRAEGLRAERPAGRTGGGALSLHEPGAAVRRAEVERAPRYLVEELPDGPVRDRLAGVLEERALLPAVRVRSAVQPLAVVNGDAKTVVRLVIEHPEAVLDSRRRVPLAPRVSVEPVLGYDTEHQRALRVLRDRLGFEPAERSLFDEAVMAVGGRPEGVSSKPGVTLAPGTRADAAAATVLVRLHEIAVSNVQGTLDDLDTEFLHDLRVSIRRARSVLRELKHVHDPGERTHLRDELKWAQALTGPVRDLDVQLLEWDQLVAPLPPERAAELEPLRTLLTRRRARELARLRRGLRGARFTNALAAWHVLATAAPVETEERPNAALPIEAVAGERIRKVYRRIVRDGRRIDDGSPPEALHDLRKRGKELRYLLELFGSPFPRKVVKPMVSTLKDLQEVLGRFQDRAVQTELLREVREELAAEPGGPAALLALGPALDALLADQAAARAQFSDRFAAFAGSEQRAVVRDTFPKS
ncbi:MAG TPA: CHAD domain-containing protein [Solirubrobacteraceae bacterium]|nr:CHAD domain-containing protein [Solirubrobacteraceae bacterium]